MDNGPNFALLRMWSFEGRSGEGLGLRGREGQRGGRRGQCLLLGGGRGWGWEV